MFFMMNPQTLITYAEFHIFLHIPNVEVTIEAEVDVECQNTYLIA